MKTFNIHQRRHKINTRKNLVPPVNTHKNHTFMHLTHKINYSIFPGLTNTYKKVYQ